MENNIRGLTSIQLKWIAMIAMVIDHVAFALVDYDTVLYDIMRGIGRLAFPIFCFVIVEGFIHTRSREKYMRNLLLFALISEIPFNLVIAGTLIYIDYQNTLFTLAFGLAAVWLIERNSGNKYLQVLYVAMCMIISQMFLCDYSFMGVLLIVIFYVFRYDHKKMFITAAIWMFFGVGLTAVADNIMLYPDSISQALADAPGYIIEYGTDEILGVISFIFIGLYNGERGKSFNKYFFYIFYPLHLTVIGIICLLMY